MSQATQEKVRWTRGTVGVQLLDDNYRPSGKLGEYMDHTSSTQRTRYGVTIETAGRCQAFGRHFAH
jgi:hypothetical protein